MVRLYLGSMTMCLYNKEDSCRAISIKKHVFFLIAFWPLINCCAQYHEGSYDQQAALDGARKSYKSTDRSLPLFNGVKYNYYTDKAIGHPFFVGNEWYRGTIKFEENVYSEVDLKYDILKNEILLSRPDEHGLFIAIVPNERKIESFSIEDHYFINIRLEKYFLTKGYYEVLVDSDRLKLLCKRTKKIETKSSRNYFSSKSSYYLILDGNSTQVRGKSSILGLFPNRKKELNRIIAHYPLQPRQSEFESNLIGIVDYLNQKP